MNDENEMDKNFEKICERLEQLRSDFWKIERNTLWELIDAHVYIREFEKDFYKFNDDLSEAIDMSNEMYEKYAKSTALDYESADEYAREKKDTIITQFLRNDFNVECQPIANPEDESYAHVKLYDGKQLTIFSEDEGISENELIRMAQEGSKINNFYTMPFEHGDEIFPAFNYFMKDYEIVMYVTNPVRRKKRNEDRESFWDAELDARQP